MVMRLCVLLAIVAAAAGLSSAPASVVMRMQRPHLRAARQVAMVEEEAMTEEEYLAELAAGESMSEEEYVAQQSEDDPSKLSAEAQRVYRGMRSSSGVEFAPWMKVDAEKIAEAKRQREERKAKAALQSRSDAMLIDPQAAELGASGGLKSKVLSEEEVQLSWSTGDETGNAGFIVQRRRGGASSFEDIESFETFAPLRTKGPTGGDYSYLDDTVEGPGTYVYRIVDCDTTGTRSAICQKLVEIEDASEQTQTLVIGGAIALLALGLVVAGIASDPIQTTEMGRNVF